MAVARGVQHKSDLRRTLFQLSEEGKNRYHEVGRSMATVLADDVFHELAYKAKNRDHLLAGLDEFLGSVVVLPPGEWDPSIRFEDMFLLRNYATFILLNG